MVEKYEKFVRACTTIEQLFTISAEIAEEFAGQDDLLEHFEALCIYQLEFINDKRITKEALEAGKLYQPMKVMAKA